MLVAVLLAVAVPVVEFGAAAVAAFTRFVIGVVTVVDGVVVIGGAGDVVGALLVVNGVAVAVAVVVDVVVAVAVVDAVAVAVAVAAAVVVTVVLLLLLLLLVVPVPWL